MKRIFTVLLCSVLAFGAFGQQLGTYSTGSTTSSGVATNITFGTLARGSGVLSASASGYYVSSNWDNTTRAAARTNNEFHGFSVQANSTYQATYTSFTFTAFRTTAGPTIVGVGYSTDGGSSWTDSPNYTLTSASTDYTNTWDFTDFTTTNSVIFRVYGWSASGTGNLRTKDFIVNGSVSSTSSPILSVSSSSLSAFSSTTVGQNSASKTFNLSGSNFTNATGDITVTAPNTDFQVSSDNVSFGATATIPYTANALAVTAVYTRFTPQSEGAKSGNITFSDPGGVTTLPTVALSGTGVAPCTTPSVVTSFSGTNGNTQTVLTWTNGLCFDEILVIARASSAVAATPSGDGSAYTANAAFGSGTDLGTSEFVVYKGTGTTQTITGLTNGTTYHFAVYTRLGTTWSAAVTANVTPAISNSAVASWSNSGTASAYYTAGNWSTGTPPSSSVVAQWNDTGTANQCVINTNTGSPTILGIEITSLRTRGLTIGNSVSANGSITLNGGVISNTSNVVIRNNSEYLLTLQDNGGGTGRLDVALGNSTENIILTDNTGGITISSIISGSNRSLTKAGAGAGVLSLTGANTYTGLTTVSAGTLQLNRTGGTTIPATNDVTVTGGTLRISTNQTLNNLVVNGGNVTVDNGVTLTINGTLTLTSGKITLGTGNVVVNGSISGGSATSYIVTSGTGTLTQTFSSARVFPVGQSASIYDPITITPSASVTFSVKASGTFTSAPADATKLFPTEWNITPSSGSPTVDLALTPGSTAGNNFNAGGTVKLGHYTGTAWEEFNATYSAGTFTATSISSFSPFGGGNQQAFNAVLPVTLTSFTANKAGAANQLTWATATEQNTAEYVVERSRDAQNFVAIGKVSAQGKSATYNFTDANPLSISYYRLRAIDYDGKEMTSKAVSVSRNSNGLKVYPTLVADNITIAAEGENSFNIINLLGQVLISGNFDTQKEISTATLPRGTYFVSVAGATVKFVKE